MAKAEEGRNITTEQLLLMQRNKFSKDLLPLFVSGNNLAEKTEDLNIDNEEIELSLGLSLNGRFGVDPRAKNKLALKRSSSISDFLTTNTTRNDDVLRAETSCSLIPLVRTCSLPTETEEWRKRKDLQSMRRMEAKRKRSEKQRSLKEGREKGQAFVEENCKEDRKGFNESPQQEQYLRVMDGFSSMEMPSWITGAKGSSICHGLELKCDKPNGGLPPQPSSQGFSGSRGSGSSQISESQSQSLQGVYKCLETKSPTSVKSSPENDRKLPTASRTKSGELNGMTMENESYMNRTKSNGAKEEVRNVLEDMPCVSSIGDGPNGKRVEGFLYGYRKGEQVRILCVCHGSFLTPSEFVKHAGGGDVAHPLKHIVVNSSSLLYS